MARLNTQRSMTPRAHGDSLHRLVAATRRRLATNQALHHAAVGIMIGAATAFVMLLIQRLGGLISIEFNPWLYAIGPGGGGVIGFVIGMATRPSGFDAAAHVDRRMRTRDRIATAQQIEQGKVRRPAANEIDFALFIQADARRVAAKIDPRTAVPLVFTSIWRIAGACAVVLAIAVAFLPTIVLARGEMSPEQIAQRQQLIEQRDAVNQDLQQALETLRNGQASASGDEEKMDALPGDRGDDDPITERMAALDRIAKQLAGEDDASAESVQQTREQAAAEISEAAEQLERRAAADAQARQELTRRFDKWHPPEGPLTDEQLAEKLRNGEFGDAADAVQRLLDQRDSMTDEQRQALARQLRSMSDAAGDVADRATRDAQLAERIEQLRDALREQGVDEQAIDELLNDQTDPSDDATTPPGDPQTEDQTDTSGDASTPPGADDQTDPAKDPQTDQQTDPQTGDAQKDDRQKNPGDRDASTPPTDPQDKQTTPPDKGDQDQSKDGQQQTQPGDQQGQQDQQSGNDGQSQTSGAGDQQRTSADGHREQDAQSAQKDDGPSRDDIERRLREQGVDEQTARRMAEDIDKTQRERKAVKQADKDGEQLGEALRDAADQLDNPKEDQQSPPEQGTGADQQSEDQQQSGDQQQQQQQTDPDKQDQTGDQQQQQGDPKQGDPKQGDPKQSDPQQGDSAAQSDASYEPQHKQTGQSSSETGEIPDKPPSPAQALRELQRRRGQGTQDRQDSQKLRDIARRMAENMTPQERKRWMEEFQRQQGQDDQQGARQTPVSPDSEPASPTAPGEGRDIRPGDQPGAATKSDDTTKPRYTPDGIEDVVDPTDDVLGDTIGELMGDGGPGASDAEHSSERLARRVREAKRVAERAVNESAVPRRYHDLIRKYFGRVGEKAKPATQDAKPANAKSGDDKSATPPSGDGPTPGPHPGAGVQGGDDS